jgi:hypothetical protein
VTARSGSALGTALVGLGFSAVVVGVVSALVPELPPLAVVGGDGVAYDAMARHPLHAVAAYPAAARLGTPLLVALMPVSVAHGFLVVGLAALLVSGALVALIAREVGLPLLHRGTTAALVAGSYIGVLTTYNRYYVDAPLLACVALALLLALRGSWAWFVCAALLTVFVKEMGVTLVVLPYLLRRAPGRWLDRRALRDSLLLAAPVVVAFVLLETVAPHVAAAGHTGRLAGIDPTGIFIRGFVVSTLNPIAALFGGITLAWPLGLVRSPSPLKRAHVWMLVAAPVLVLGSWERTLGPFLPFVVPAALFALRDAPWARTVLFALGSLAATAVAGSETIGNGATTVSHKLLLVAPGLLLAAAMLVPEYAAATRPAVRARASRAP